MNYVGLEPFAAARAGMDENVLPIRLPEVVVVEMVMMVVVRLVRWQRRRQRLRRLPPVDLGEEVLGALPEKLVGELPPICHYLPKALQQQKQQIKPKKTFSIFFLQ